MGHGYKGDTGHYHTIGENVGTLRDKFTFNESTGYFGVRGKSGQGNVRNIASDDPAKTAKAFYDIAGRGGIEEPLANGKGFRVSMKDGSIITYREVSSSDGSPAVDIHITSSSDDTGGVRTQKIHFVRKKEV